MPRKPLINENLLQKIAKAPPFYFRSRQSPQRPAFGFQSLEICSPINKQLQKCIELINRQVQQKFTKNRDFLQFIAKILLDIKTKWQSIEQKILQIELEQQERAQQIMRKSSNKYFSRIKMEFSEQPKLIQGMFLIDKSTNGQLKKNILNKVKIGKENNQRVMINSQIKIEKIANKLEQTEIIVKEQKGQIQSLKKQIQNLIDTRQQLIMLKKSTDYELVAIRNKMKCLIDEKMELESSIQEKICAQKKKTQQSINQCKVLRQRLQERQKQISALWQLHKN